MKNILWLVSWYPNHYDAHNGDFIKRHAQALSLFANVHVLFITPVNKPDADYMEEEINSTGNLTEQIVYYKANESSAFGKLQSQLRYLKLSRYFIRQYIHQHGLPDYVHAHVPIRAGLVAMWMKRKYKLNYALTEHYGIYNKEVADPFQHRNKIAEDINNIVVKKPYTVIPNVVNTGYFNFKEKEFTDKFQFLHVSNMIPLKNVEGIIDAAEKLYAQRKDFELTIVGNYPAHTFEYAKQKNLPIKFTGVIPYEQVAGQMQQSDAFILFSNTENNPCVLLESLCCGLPVISSRVGGVPEIVSEENGLMVEARNVNQLFTAMNDMVNNTNKYNRRKISETASAKYSYEAIGRQIYESYKKQ
jgi:glycosyltransferase involved in cell wall biosynthesis